jgi:putative ABC transport system permease protein
MGASRARLARQLLTESLLLSVISGVVALFTVLLLKNAILSIAPPDLPRLNEVSVSAGALAFAFLISLIAGFLFGLAPALQAANPGQMENLREGSRGTGFSRRHTRLSRLLVVSEVALSMILLTGAGLLLRSFWHVLEVHPGYNPSHLTTVQIWMPVSNNPRTDPYAQEDKRAAFLQEVYRRVSAIPGVEQSSIAGNDTLPMNSGRNYSKFSIEGRAAESEHSPIADIAVVDAQYFQTMEVPLLSGRNFLPTDSVGAQGVAVVDQTLAHRCWPDKNPIGSQIKFGFGAGVQGLTIVGVVGDIRSDGSELPSVPHIYVAMGQFAPVNAVVFFRSRENAEYLGEAVRREVAQVDLNVPVHSIVAMNEIIARSMADRRFAFELFGIFASAALLLAAVGIYGVMAYSFSQRTHEVGVRIALGAQRFDILRMAMSEGMRVVVIGLACGLAGAAILTRLFRAMLFNVAPADPLTFLSVSAILASVAFLACYIPAQRATCVDPQVALREE